jgi:hypothetical protein
MSEHPIPHRFTAGAALAFVTYGPNAAARIGTSETLYDGKLDVNGG